MLGLRIFVFHALAESMFLVLVGHMVKLTVWIFQSIHLKHAFEKLLFFLTLLSKLLLVLLGVVVWFAVVFFHYAFFRKIIEKFCNRFISPSVIEDEPLSRYVGETTAVVSVDGKRMLRLEGDLVAFKNSEKFNDGDEVEVISFKEGVVEVVKK